MKNIHGKELGKSTEQILRKQHKGDFLASFTQFWTFWTKTDIKYFRVVMVLYLYAKIKKKRRRKRRKFGKILRKR